MKLERSQDINLLLCLTATFLSKSKTVKQLKSGPLPLLDCLNIYGYIYVSLEKKQLPYVSSKNHTPTRAMQSNERCGKNS